MKRSGFTMIELIFVIVILGILAAVALPKFIGVSEQADASKCDSFVGTLNRTVGPAIWSDQLLNDPANIADAVTAAKISAQIDIPANCGTAAQYDAAVDGTAFTITLGSGTYEVNGTAPSSTVAPLWAWTKQ